MSPHSPARPWVMTLVHASSGDLMQLRHLDDLTTSEDSTRLMLKNGDVVQCLQRDETGVLIARGDGSRMLVPLVIAHRVGIRRLPELWDLEDSEDGAIAIRDTP